MLSSVVRRLVLTIPVLFGVVFVVFVLARVLPGNPCFSALGERATPAACVAFNHRNGLDQPILNQFWIYLQQVASFNFGDSVKYGEPVTDLLVQRLPTTVELSLFALFFAIVIGVPLGVISAYRRNSIADVATMILANLGVSTPVFVLGLILAYFFAVNLKGTPLALPPSGRLSSGVDVVPLAQAYGISGLGGPLRALLDFVSNMYTISSLISGQWGAFVDGFRHLILPAVALGTIPMSIIARITRSSLLDVLGVDYVRTARAKGLTERLVFTRHALRNALLPLVTVVGLQVGALLSGAVLTETVFSLPGVGTTLYDAIISRDYVVVQAFTLVIGVGYVLVNLLVDVSYAYLDPRIRLS